ncbi:MAG: methyl-accepting chemotaxis protein [Candidatus Viridilinea halotolerans]|uniref:Methyl-accepting chemotaxis protein n=1 Tax=Candidatus Viridilinea halotolerans TaxID=2491704 RepID=A0A426TQI6_9CHLR|nr:MAG: methyl-accepting chemotaxis protein [Candidatus Viridilinea halotolerans]
MDSSQSTSLRDNVITLAWLIGGSMALLLVYWLSVLLLWGLDYLASQNLLFASLASVIALIAHLAALLLLRRKLLVLSRRTLFYALLLAATAFALVFGGPAGPLTILFLVPVVTAGLLGEGYDSTLVALAAVFLYALMGMAQQSALLNPLVIVFPLSLLPFTVAATFLAFIAWLSGRDLARVVQQSRSRADELLHKTEQLMEKSIQQVELGSELATAAGELQTASQQQASGATEQASAVTQVSTTIEELGSTARQIAQSADHVSQAAQQTLENLSTGQGAVDESIQAMERIRGRVSDVSNRVLSLGERSQQIGEIIDLIDDISDETHLLALNAAIEAAGAGEHGRRFAVVAAEVKSLANRTLAAAREVKGVIAEIRQATAAAVLAAEEGSKEVERGVELAHRAGQTMDNIVMVAERTAQSAAEIGLATAQQQSASEQVVETMREIAEVARQTALGARQMAESAAMLTAIADRLHGIVVSEGAKE